MQQPDKIAAGRNLSLFVESFQSTITKPPVRQAIQPQYADNSTDSTGSADSISSVSDEMSCFDLPVKKLRRLISEETDGYFSARIKKCAHDAGISELKVVEALKPLVFDG